MTTKKKMTETQTSQLTQLMENKRDLLYVAAVMAAYVGFASLYITPKEVAISEILNSLYSVFVASSISLFVLREVLQTKSVIQLPVFLLFALISLVDLLDYLFDDFIGTYKPLLTIIVTVTTCYIILYLIWLWLNRNKL